MKPIDFLKSGEYDLEFKWINKKTLGLIDPETRKITMNIELLFSYLFVHEFCHDEYPQEEEQIEIKTWQRLHRMTVAEIKELAGYLFAFAFSDNNQS